MGVEYRIIRKDNKTIFDIGKRIGPEILDYVFSQEQLLEYLTLWQLQFCQGVDPIYSFIIRDRIIDFIEGAKLSDLKVVGDTWWDCEDEAKDYIFTHDRYATKEQVEAYNSVLVKSDIEDYMVDPLKFFRDNNLSKGTNVDESNRIKAMCH